MTMPYRIKSPRERTRLKVAGALDTEVPSGVGYRHPVSRQHFRAICKEVPDIFLIIERSRDRHHYDTPKRFFPGDLWIFPCRLLPRGYDVSAAGARLRRDSRTTAGRFVVEGFSIWRGMERGGGAGRRPEFRGPAVVGGGT